MRRPAEQHGLGFNRVIQWETPRSGKTAFYSPGQTCAEVEKAVTGTPTTILNCTNYTAAAVHPTTYADASVLLSSPIKTSGNVIGLSAFGPAGSQTPNYLLILNVADG